ncbi:uncharacterized protein LOC144103910 isoform X3 [Amblyomma americanum]
MSILLNAGSVVTQRGTASPDQDSSHKMHPLSHCVEPTPGMGNHQDKPTGKNLHKCTHCRGLPDWDVNSCSFRFKP